MALSRRPEYHSAQQNQWHPYATYTILGIIVLFYVAQMIVIRFDWDLHWLLFAINSEWPFHPWTLITATLSHSPVDLFHILINGLVLFFFGPTLERLIGWKRFTLLFFAAGALASVAQVYVSMYLHGTDRFGLGASGAIMMVFGALMIVMPTEKILIWGIIPVPFWAAGVAFAAWDVFNSLNPASNIGGVAHLSGMAIGFWVGWRIRQTMKKQGLRLVRG